MQYFDIRRNWFMCLWFVAITAIACADLIEMAQPPPRALLQSLVQIEAFFVDPHSVNEQPRPHTCGGTVIRSESWHVRSANTRSRSFILTAAHCIGNARAVSVVWRGTDGMHDAVEMTGKVIATEWFAPDSPHEAARRTDLALIQVDDHKLPAATMLFERPVAGESVWLIGYPLGNPASIVQQFVANMDPNNGFFVHTTTALPGDSGGGLFVLRRSCLCYKLVGVTDAVPSLSINPMLGIPASKLTYAIPMDVVARFLFRNGILSELPAGITPEQETEKES